MTRIVLAWLATRVLTLWLLFGPESWVTGDVAYYAQSLQDSSATGLEQTLVEYPLPGVVLVALPWWLALAVGEPDGYRVTVMLFALVTDALLAGLLVWFGRAHGDTRLAGAWVWVYAVPLLGALTYARFDLVPGFLAALALLLLAARPRFAAACAAVATSVKLWPVVLLPALAAPPRSRRGVTGVVVGVGVAVAALSVLVAGWQRLLSPLTWQGERGLQIESVAATPAMVAWVVAPSRYQVGFSEFNAFEVSGPGVGGLLTAAGVVGLVGLVGLAALWAWLWRAVGSDRASSPHGAVVWACLAAVCVLVVTSKVLSPQYLLWLLPAAAAAVAVADAAQRAPLTRWAGVLLVAAACTHLVFPIGYAGLAEHRSWSWLVVAVLALRNLLVLWLTVEALRRAAGCLRPARGQRGSALDRQAPGPDAIGVRTAR